MRDLTIDLTSWLTALRLVAVRSEHVGTARHHPRRYSYGSTSAESWVLAVLKLPARLADERFSTRHLWLDEARHVAGATGESMTIVAFQSDQDSEPACVAQGATVVVMPKFELGALCQYIEKYRITVCMLVPPIALQLARNPVVEEYRVDSLKLIISGAAPLGPELETEVQNRLRKRGADVHVAQAYGLTESSPTTHYCPIAKPTPGSIGPLLPMMRARIVDPETDKDVLDGGSGELLLQGPNIMLGYLNRPEANAETLVKNEDGVWLKTGDIARVDERGFFFITDRLKELIKVKVSRLWPHGGIVSI